MSLAALAASYKRVKYQPTASVELTRNDAIWIALAAIATAAVTTYLPPFAAWIAAAAYAIFFAALLLDAILYRVFTIELGPHGIGGVIFSDLYLQVMGLSSARTFLRANLAHLFLPAAAAFAVVRLSWSVDQPVHWISSALLAVYLLAMSLPKSSAHDLRYFIARRRPSGAATPTLNEDDRAWIEAAPEAYRPSDRHGVAKGASIVVLSFESLGRAHLEQASAPFWDRFSREACTSRHHAAIAPSTNAAHAAWYSGQYDAAEKSATNHLAALKDAGYRTIYMTTAETEHYGLHASLQRAGFDEIYDARHFRPEALDEGRVSDHALPTQAPALLLAGEPGDKLYLHVHAANAHMPYRVVDRARYSRFPADGDRGRFLNSIEETDAVFAALLEALPLSQSPVVVLTSDHGQSFGELGYFGHGSAVVHHQLDVPFAIRHAALPPSSVASSSHFDLLPTLLDLAGVRSDHKTYGRSIFDPRPRPKLLVLDGNPSRERSSVYGAILGERKLSVDLVRDTVVESDLRDADARVLIGEERAYAHRLLAELMRRRCNP